MFDTFVMVDWSAANQPRQGRDSIWICWHAPDGNRLENPRTRYEAKALLADLLAPAVARGERVLIGFDFPFGYPAGFASKLGLTGRPWRAVWDEVARLVSDDEHNSNNRFDVAAMINERISGEKFPFWGCPAQPVRNYLGPKHHRGHERNGLAERRLIDEYMTGAQPCWKLLGAGSVGGQVLTGIPVVRALRDDPRWRRQARVWPFETGLCTPTDAQVVFAEVYPSLWKVSPVGGEPKDKAQVRAVAGYFAERGQEGDLARLFAGDPELTSAQRRQVEAEEAWTLGVTARAQRPIATRTATAEQDRSGNRYTYLRNPAEIRRRSFALIQAEASFARFPRPLKPLALRLAHAAGDTALLKDLAWSRGAVAAGRRALAGGAPILVDTAMVAAGINCKRLAAGNAILCSLGDPETVELARALGTTRTAAAVELWRPHLAGAVVAIGNAPTALFHLLEIIVAGAAKPALVLGFPVGFVGAADAKATLVGFDHGIAFVTLKGRRGGSALAAAAVNALADIG
jgi:precorrin-8X/cobalt-precorrin-8 methylmutase